MADKVAITTELNIVLSNASGTATRVLKISVPKEASQLTFAQIRAALAPAFIIDDTNGDFYFFYDDGNQGGYEEPMDHVEYAEWVNTVKTTRRYDQGS